MLNKSENDAEKRELRNQVIYATILAARASSPETGRKTLRR